MGNYYFLWNDTYLTSSSAILILFANLNSVNDGEEEGELQF